MVLIFPLLFFAVWGFYYMIAVYPALYIANRKEKKELEAKYAARDAELLDQFNKNNGED